MHAAHSEATLQLVCTAAQVEASSVADLADRPDLPELLIPVLDNAVLVDDNNVRSLLLELAVSPANPLVLEAIVEAVLGQPHAAAALGDDLVDQWLELAQRQPDLLGGIALEASTRLALADAGRRYAVLDHLRRLRRRLSDVTDEFAYRLVRVAGAVGEHFDLSMAMALLTDLLNREAVAHDAAFELGMMHLRGALATSDHEQAKARLIQARQRFTDALADEERPDATAFGSAIDAIMAFSAGQPAPPALKEQLRTAVFEIRLGCLGMPSSWRSPRYDALAAWHRLVLELEEAQEASAKRAWLYAASLIKTLVDVYAAHRTLHLLPTAGAGATVDLFEQAGLHALLAPNVEQLLRVHDADGELLAEWLHSISAQPTQVDDPEAIAVHGQAVALLAAITAGTEPPPKPGSPAAHSFTGLTKLGVDIADYPELAARISSILDAREAAVPIDAHPMIADTFRQVQQQLQLQCPEQYVGQFALDVDAMLLHLLRFMYLRLTETQKFGGDARAYLRYLSPGSARPLEKELGKDLRDFLTGVGLRVFLEETNVGGGRVDVAWHPHDERITLELKRDWEDPNWHALARKFLAQTISYLVDSPAIIFLVVLDLTDKPDGLAALSACHHVRTVPGPAGDPRPRTVVMLRVQGNKRDPSSL